MKAGSASVVAALRWLARGAAIASGRVDAEVEPLEQHLEDAW